MTEFVDYPPGVQDLLLWAKFHLKELDKLELEFRAWQAAQAEAKPALCAETLLLLGAPSRAEQARLRWEAMARTACLPQTGGDEKVNL